MKILYIAHESGEGFGGASRSLLTMIDYFQKENETFVLIPCASGRMYEELCKRKCRVIVNKYYWSFVFKNENKINWYLHRMVWVLYRKWYNKIVSFKLAYFIKKNNIDIVHTNSTIIDLGAQAAKLAGCKHIWHLREFGQEDFGMYPLNGEKKFINELMENSYKVITVSDALRKKYQEKLKKNQIVTIYNGIEISDKIVHEEHTTFNLLISGLVSEAKGQIIALKAMRLIMQKGIVDIHLYIAGKGSIYFLKKQFDDLSNNVHFLGQVEDMVHLRGRMDVELVCSKSEAFGRVTVEAMISELPVIGSNSGGTSELIIDGKNGLLYDYGDVKQLAEKIIYMYKHREEMQAMGKVARCYAIERYNVENYIKAVEKIYIDANRKEK